MDIEKTNVSLIDYKPAKTTKEMVEYLEKTKNVVYNSINKQDAENILFKYNYINVITPFKHKFAEKNEKNEVIKIANKHVYKNSVDFSQYYNNYLDERNKYPTIYKNISEFETIFKSIVSYKIVNGKNKINNSEELCLFLKSVEMRISLLQFYSEERKMNIIKNIRDMEGDISKYHDIYCFFDRTSLGHLLSLYTGLENETQIDILMEMKKLNLHFEVSDTNQFIDRVFTLVGVRNCIMHNNSLEILVRFYNTSTKSLRTPRDRNKFITMIETLSKEKQLD